MTQAGNIVAGDGGWYLMAGNALVLLFGAAIFVWVAFIAGGKKSTGTRRRS